MAKMNFVENSDNTMKKVKTIAKEQMLEFLISKLREEFGDESTNMMRWGKGEKSKTTEIGTIGGTVEYEGETYELIFGINATVKEYRPYSGPKKDYNAFDVRAAWDEFNEKAESDAAKAKDAEEKKAKKIEKDNAKREAQKKLRETEDTFAGLDEF